MFFACRCSISTFDFGSNFVEVFDFCGLLDLSLCSNILVAIGGGWCGGRGGRW